MNSYRFFKRIPNLLLFLMIGYSISCTDTDSPGPDGGGQDTVKEAKFKVSLYFNIASFSMASGSEDDSLTWQHVLGGDEILLFQSSDSSITFNLSDLTLNADTVQVELPEGDYSLSVSNDSGPFVSNIPLSGFMEKVKVRNDTILKMNVVPDYGLVLVAAAGIDDSKVPAFIDSVDVDHQLTLRGEYYYLYINQGTKGAVELANLENNVYINEINVAARTIYLFDLNHLTTVVADTLVDRSGYLYKVLPGDAPRHTSTTNAQALWDGQIKGWPNTIMLTQSDHTPGVPHMITIDLGEEAQLSRVHLWDYPEWGQNGQNIYYAHGAMRKLEIYGAVDYNVTGELDESWTKLGEYQNVKPSGLPQWEVNQEDIEAGEAGFDYYFDQGAPKVRYIRIRCLENWDEGTFMALAELEFYRFK